MKKFQRLFFILLICSFKFFVIANENERTLIPFIESGKIGFFDENKDVVFIPQFLTFTGFDNGYAVVGKSENQYNVISVEGKVVLTFYSELASQHFTVSSDRILFMRNGLYGFYDLQGNVVLDGFELAKSFSDGLALIREDGYFYYIKPDGSYLRNFFFRKIRFKEANSFNEGVARIGKDFGSIKKYGYINKKGKVIIPIEYEYLDKEFSNGLCSASIDWNKGMEEYGNIGFINLGGGWVIPPVYYAVREYSSKVASVRYVKGLMGPGNPYWKLIDNHGNDVHVFDEKIMVVSDFSNGMARYKVYNENNFSKYGFFDEAGNLLSEPIFDQILSKMVNGYCSVIYKGESVLFSREDGIVRPRDYLNFK